jgi:DNA replication protein DnaC
MNSHNRDALKDRLKKLGLYGVLSRVDELTDAAWIQDLVEIEEADRAQRSLERRVRRARLGRFKPIVDFDWAWPKRLDREAVEDLFSLSFLDDAANVVLVGPNGVGKTTIAANLAHRALMKGKSVLGIHASAMLADLAKQDTSTALARRLRCYTQVTLLLIDELGYLAYDARLGDLLFEVISRRHEQRSTIVTTNLPFAE